MAKVLSWVGRLVEGLWCAHLLWGDSANQGFPRCAQRSPGELLGLWAFASLLTTTTGIAAGMGQAGSLGAQGMARSQAEPRALCRCALLSQLFSHTFLACCLAMGMAAGALPECCATGFIRVNLSLLGFMSKRIPSLAYGQSFAMQPCLMSHSRNRPFWTELGIPIFLVFLVFYVYITFFFSINTKGTNAVDTVVLSSIHWNKEGRVVKTNGRKLTNWRVLRFSPGAGIWFTSTQTLFMSARTGVNLC